MHNEAGKGDRYRPVDRKRWNEGWDRAFGDKMTRKVRREKIMTKFDHVKDSGQRQEFQTGAVRDIRSGKGRYDLILSLPHMLYRLARHFENGAVKYGDDNWRKGLPLRRFVDSAFRHLCQYAAGNNDEDHLAAAIWNLMCHGETANEIAAGRLPAELDDMPKYEQQICSKCPPVPASTSTTFYICGPMRGYPRLNFDQFDYARNLGQKLGYRCINPADLDRETGIDPEMKMYDCKVAQGLLDEIIRRDIAAIMALNPAKDDGIAVLPGWEKSAGARAEVALAKWRGLRVVSALDFKTLIEVTY